MFPGDARGPGAANRGRLSGRLLAGRGDPRTRRNPQDLQTDEDIAAPLFRDGDRRLTLAVGGDLLLLDPDRGLVLDSKAPLAALEHAIALLYDATLRVDRKGQLGLKQLPPIAQLATGATLAQTVAKVQEIIDKMDQRGWIERT